MAILAQAPDIFALEPVMHAGEHFSPGEQIPDVDINEVGALLAGGRCTTSKDRAAQAKRNFASAKQARADAEAAKAAANTEALAAILGPVLAQIAKSAQSSAPAQ